MAVLIFCGVTSGINCFIPRRDSKPTAMFLFECEPHRRSAKGKNREGGSGRNFRQKIDAGRTLVDSVF